jgi:AmmeMemoRadiSam system protein B
MGVVRPPAVAGTFYPGSAVELGHTITQLLADSDPPDVDIDAAVLIVPHAGYVYSGPVAATAYRLLAGLEPRPRRIVVLGPSHFVRFAGIAAPEADALQTPLGLIAVDATIPEGVTQSAAAHATEHSLEVQLPFLQHVLEAFTVLPLLTGDVAPEETAGVLGEALDRHGSLGILSSDLSHYHDYRTALSQDGRTAQAIIGLRPDDIQWDDACGATAIKAALLVGRERGWLCRLLDLRNSGDTAGDRSRVVGYGAFVLGPQRP